MGDRRKAGTRCEVDTGPSETDLERHDCGQERKEAEEKTEDYSETMPPAILFQMIEANRDQIRGTSSGIRIYTYSVRTDGCSPQLAEWEEIQRKSNGTLNILAWQFQKRKKQEHEPWDMPLVVSDAESGGSLYARMVEAIAES